MSVTMRDEKEVKRTGTDNSSSQPRAGGHPGAGTGMFGVHWYGSEVQKKMAMCCVKISNNPSFTPTDVKTLGSGELKH